MGEDLISVPLTKKYGCFCGIQHLKRRAGIMPGDSCLMAGKGAPGYVGDTDKFLGTSEIYKIFTLIVFYPYEYTLMKLERFFLFDSASHATQQVINLVIFNISLFAR